MFKFNTNIYDTFNGQLKTFERLENDELISKDMMSDIMNRATYQRNIEDQQFTRTASNRSSKLHGSLDVNAYLLFYEQRLKKKEDTTADIDTTSSTDATTTNEAIKEINVFQQPIDPIPNQLKQLIKEELSTNLGLVGLTDINEVDKKIIAEKFFKDIKY